jgi:tRNA 2-thiouridine synthesizing protein B
MLYTVNKSPLMFGNLESLLRIAPAGEPVLLYEDGVYAAVKGAASEDMVKQTLAQHPVEGIQVVDYDGFVELVEQHHVVPWL